MAFAGCEAEVSDGDDYSEKRITITYVDESGNILKTDSQTSYGSVWLSYIKTGYVCTYYDSNGKKIETKYNYKTESDCKIIVKFTPIKYTIKFEKKSSYSVSMGLSKKKWAALIILNLQENSNLLKFKYEQRRKR